MRVAASPVPQDPATGVEQAGVDASTSGEEEGRAGSMLERRVKGDLRIAGVCGRAWPGTCGEGHVTRWSPRN